MDKMAVPMDKMDMRERQERGFFDNDDDDYDYDNYDDDDSEECHDDNNDNDCGEEFEDDDDNTNDEDFDTDDDEGFYRFWIYCHDEGMLVCSELNRIIFCLHNLKNIWCKRIYKFIKV